MSSPGSRLAVAGVSTGLFLLVGLIAQGGARFLTNVFIGRFGGPEALAVSATILAIAGLVSLLGPSSFGSAASRFVAAEKAQGGDGAANGVALFLRARNVRLAAVSFGVSFLGSLLITQGILLSLTLGAVVLVTCIVPLERGVLLGDGQGRRVALMDIGTAVIGIVALAILYALGVRSYLLVNSLFVGMAGVWLFRKRLPKSTKSSMSKSGAREIYRFVAWGAWGTVVAGGLIQLTTMVGHLFGDSSVVAPLAAGVSTVTPLALMGSAVSMVIYPKLSSLRALAEDQAVKLLLFRATLALQIASVVCFGALIVWADELVLLVWGSEFEKAGVVVAWMAVGLMANTMAVASVNHLTSGDFRGVRASAAASTVGAVVTGFTWLAGYAAGWDPLVAVPGGYAAGIIVTSLIPTLLTAATVRGSHIVLSVTYTAVMVAVSFFVSTSVTVP